ncbi:MAG: hydroxymethylbilane synthase [Fibrobacter sp.]|nr:hydroxymethylbilane synthase [Fibrobacter sp.]
MNKKLRLGTRTSPLAMAQTEITLKVLQEQFPQYDLEVVPIQTQGDKDKVRSLVSIGGSGVFVKELEQALLDFKIDIAVHSLKDVPSDMDSRLVLAGFLKRASANDVLVAKNHKLKSLPLHAKVGTGSPRRILQLREHRPDLNFVDLRGNLASRIEKVNSGDLDAILLGAAGLERLNLFSEVSEVLPPEIVTPAIGQGIIGLQSLGDRSDVCEILKEISDPFTYKAARLERTWMELLGGGCRAPMAAYLAPYQDKGAKFYVYLADPNTKVFHRDIWIHRTGFWTLEEFENLTNEFINQCESLKIPIPKKLEAHSLMDFWGKL